MSKTRLFWVMGLGLFIFLGSIGFYVDSPEDIPVEVGMYWSAFFSSKYGLFGWLGVVLFLLGFVGLCLGLKREPDSAPV